LTGLQIIKLANRHVDDDIEYLDGVYWINECLVELGEDAKLFDTATIEVTDTTAWYDIPTNMIRVIEFEDSNGEVSYVDYVIRNGKIKISATGTYSIYYSKLSTEIEIVDEDDETEIETALSAEIDCHKLLHKCVALFLASRFKDMDNSDEIVIQDAQRLMKEFEYKKAKALRQINELDNYNNLAIRVI